MRPEERLEVAEMLLGEHGTDGEDDAATRRNRLIDAFGRTRESGCFDPATTAPISPAPNPDGLDSGGR